MKPDCTLQLNSMSDADFAGLFKVDPMEDASSVNSQMGCIIRLGGCLFVWKSQLITSVCLATAKAECCSLSHCLWVLLAIRDTLGELVEHILVPLEIQGTISSTAFEDNSAARLSNQRLTYCRGPAAITQLLFTSGSMWTTSCLVPIAPCESALMDAEFLTKACPVMAMRSTGRESKDCMTLTLFPATCLCTTQKNSFNRWKPGGCKTTAKITMNVFM